METQQIYNLPYIHQFKANATPEMFRIYLSDAILTIIEELNNTVIEQAPPSTPHTSSMIHVNTHDRHSYPPSSSHGAHHRPHHGSYPRKFDKRHRNHNNNNNADNWNAEKPVFKPTMSMKLTKEGIDKDLNEIRAILNKITNKNYETNRDTIMELITNLLEHAGHPEEHIQTIAQFVYDTASSNKFYGEVYADLYKELVDRFQIFSDILLQFVSTYNDQIGTIQYVDSNVDYDGYCAYTKANEKRKATANFLVLLMKRGILDTQVIVDLIRHFQDVFYQYITEEDRVNEVDEITEVLFLFISVGHTELASAPEWHDTILTKVEAASKLKAKEQKSLSSRAVFKYMDLWKKISS
jgi:hypothetical protein